ncbi:MAG: TIGR01777 family oxidoreductase [Verrucomicrobiota bacterium]
MKIAITGASGLVGTAAVEALRAAGHSVTPIPRGRFELIAGHEAVVHLAGESIAGRWTTAKKARIRSSRVDETRRLSEVLAGKVLVCASAIGFYGDRGDEVLTEDRAMGRGFLAEVCRDWEGACSAERVVNLRFGVVLSGRGGALAKMLLPFRLGAGGVMGSGRQWWSWVAVEDAVGAIQMAVENEAFRGPVNVVAPQAVTNSEFTKTLGRVLRRPTIVPMPAFAARVVFGEMADELLLASQRVQPARLVAAGFKFRLPDLDSALAHCIRGGEGVTLPHNG